MYCCDASGSCKSPDADVIIVGAGVSGIAAASTFSNSASGLTNFLILEARSADIAIAKVTSIQLYV